MHTIYYQVTGERKYEKLLYTYAVYILTEENRFMNKSIMMCSKLEL
jgi:hypothetical protein